MDFIQLPQPGETVTIEFRGTPVTIRGEQHNGTCVYLVGCDGNLSPLQTPPLITYVQPLDEESREQFWQAIQKEVHDDAEVNQEPFPPSPVPLGRVCSVRPVFPRIKAAIRRWRAKALVGAVD